MLNVLHLIHYLGGGGSEKNVYSLIKKLHNKKCNFYIAYSEEGNGKKPFDELGVPLIKLDMKSPFDIRASKELKRLCGELSIDVIHTHFLRENYIAILSKFLGNKARIINTRHMLFENSRSVILTNRIFTRFNDKIIAVSFSVKDQLIREGIRPEKIKLIYTGIDLEEWNIPAPNTFRKEFGIPEDEFLITSVARFSPEKGHDFFIDSIKYFRDHMNENNIPVNRFKFILVGDGELYEPIIDKAKALGLQNDIIFTGYRTDIKNILKSSNIFISHSINESFGISILEGMAAGLPVITTDSGGTREIVNDRLKNGVLIDYGDKKKLAEGLIDLINNKGLRDLYIDQGYKVAKEYFSLDKTAEETYNLYVFNKGSGDKND